MTPEQQRIAIAEACGWYDLVKQDVSLFGKHEPESQKTFELDVPDYLNDLNAMHEAEKVLPIDRQYEYGEKLRVISGNVGPKGGHFTPNGFGCYALAHLSATQRAEAFLRTLNLWKD